MNDVAEVLRRERLIEINAEPQSRQALETAYGEVWDGPELSRDFVVEGFLAPYVVVVRKRDHQRGSLEFQHQPRYYFSFAPDAP